MKFLFTILALFITSISLSQSQNQLSNDLESELTIHDVNLSFTVDSEEDIESAFQVKDIKDLLKTSAEFESMSFEIVCNGDIMSNGENSTLTYKVKGDSENISSFLKSVRKIRKGAINYYKNKQ